MARLGRSYVKPVYGRGRVVTTSAAYSLTASAGNITYVGAATILRFNRAVVASAGSITYAGIAATLQLARKVAASPGTVVYQGISATLSYSATDIVLTANVGTITLAGLGATLVYNRKLISGAGSINYLGGSASLVQGGGILTPTQLAQLYGGGALHEKGKKKKKKPDENLAVMVKALTNQPVTKHKLIALLPVEVEPDKEWEVTTMKLIKETRESSLRVQKQIERLYADYQRNEDDEAFVFLNF